MLLALMRNLAGHDREVRSGRWDYQLGGRLRRPSLLTLGVVGLGRIGRMTAERLGRGSARSSATTRICRTTPGPTTSNGSMCLICSPVARR